MARDEDKRWRCGSCGTITLEFALLTAQSPFDETDILTACPECKWVGDFDEICDEPGCTEEASCWFRVADEAFGDYRRTCNKHGKTALAAPKAIVAEVAGAEQPFSADSYVPPHLVHDPREAITGAEDISAGLRKSVREYAAHEELLLAMLAKANAIITELRAEIDGMRCRQIHGQPPGAVFGPVMSSPDPLVFDPAGRFTAYARRECDV